MASLAAAQAPEAPARLKIDVEALAKEREAAAKEVRGADLDSLAAERIKLRTQLLELLKRLEQRRPAIPTAEASPKPKEVIRPKIDLGEGTQPVDALRAAQNLFRANDFDAALRAFRLLDLSTLAREDRAFAQYMTACCLRRLGKLSDAAVLYREVADAKDDDFITECALWQLGAIRSAQELETQLDELRLRRKSW